MDEVQQSVNYENEIAGLESKIESSAKWFYWVAGLSVVNTLIIFFGGEVSFIVGLGITQLIDGFVYEASETAKFVVLFINILISGMFAIFGYFALKQEKWAFIVGMVLYFLDGLIFLLVDDWLSIAFHAYVLFSLFGGIKSLNKIDSIKTSVDGGLHRIEKEISKL